MRNLRTVTIILLFFIAIWSPTFTGYDGRINVKVDGYQYLIGLPDCGKMQMWPVYNDPQVCKLFQLIRSVIN